MAITLFGVTLGAALATMVGVLTEVPFMLILVQLCQATKGTFRSQSLEGEAAKAPVARKWPARYNLVYQV